MKRTSTEAHAYIRHHQGAKVKHFDVSNVIYHKFSLRVVSYMYTLNGENVNVMLELLAKYTNPATSDWIMLKMRHFTITRLVFCVSALANVLCALMDAMESLRVICCNKLLFQSNRV